MRFFLVILIPFFFSCNETKVQQKDFIGIWKADDGATIQLKGDGMLIGKDVNMGNIVFNGENSRQLTDLKGIWKLETDENNRKVIRVEAQSSNTFFFDFYISGQGISENQPPWDIYVFVGDPDEMNKYRFIKQ